MKYLTNTLTPKTSNKRFFKTLLILFSITFSQFSFSQSYTGLIQVCKDFHIGNTTAPLTCPFEICIQQTITCPNDPSCPEQQPASTSINTCVTISPWDEQKTICYYDIDSNSEGQPQCKCTVLTTSISIRRVSTGETVYIPSGLITTFLNILNGTDTVSSIPLTYTFDCNGNPNANTIHWKSIGGFPTLDLQ